MNWSKLISLILPILVATSAWPCGFHNYAPKATIVEKMLESSAIVLARQNAQLPFRYEVKELLLGQLPETRIPYLVDGASRQKLRNEGTSVLFSYSGDTQRWSRLATVDERMRPILDDILTKLPEWRKAESAGRAQTFAHLLQHPNADIRTLALNELELVSYEILRGLTLQVDSGAILEGLGRPQERDHEPIRVLLLGLSKDPSVAARLEKGVAANRNGFGPYLGAYATAWIELMGPEAVEALVRDHVAGSGTKQPAQRLILEALALHRNYGEPNVRNAVSREMAIAIQGNPKLSALAARYFAGGADGPDQEGFSDRSAFGMSAQSAAMPAEASEQ